MTSQLPLPLPERANLEQLKKQAKSLLHAARAGDSSALERFRLLPAFSRKPVADLSVAGLALHDAQSVIAREYGFDSWNALRNHVEERSLSFAAAVDEFVRCATGSASGRALRLLALHPGIAHASLQAELVLGDADGVQARLRAQPSLAIQPGGIQNWEPLLYVCHTCVHRDEPARKVLVDFKTGRLSPMHLEDLRFYALIETLRTGTPPRRVASYYLDQGRFVPEDVTVGARSVS